MMRYSAGERTGRSLLAMLSAVAAVSIWAPSAAHATPLDDTNKLQRAVWACEAGAQKFSAQKANQSTPRFFLNGADRSAAQELGSSPPLLLLGNKLGGIGRMSDDDGWHNIHFECTLTPDLKVATAFEIKRQWKMPVNTHEVPQSPAISASTPKMAWHAGTEGPALKTLTFGIPETDDRNFMMSCLPGSNMIVIPLTQTIRGLQSDHYSAVTITAGSYTGLYIARGALDEGSGAVMPVLTVDLANDPLLQKIRKDQNLHINISGELAYDVMGQSAAKPGAGALVQRFENICKGPVSKMH